MALTIGQADQRVAVDGRSFQVVHRSMNLIASRSMRGGAASDGGHDLNRAFFGRALAIWFVIMGVETLHGTLRTLLLAPWLGDLPTRQVGVLIGSLLILLIAHVSAPWLRATTRRSRWLVGMMWVGLTVVFEFSLGYFVLGYGWDRFWQDYDLARGGFMGFGLIVLAAAPAIAARCRRVRGDQAASGFTAIR